MGNFGVSWGSSGGSEPPLHLAHNRGAPVPPAVQEAIGVAYRQGGNPSSLHGRGRAARRALEGSRDILRRVFGWGGRILFTGSVGEAWELARTAREHWQAIGVADSQTIPTSPVWTTSPAVSAFSTPGALLEVADGGVFIQGGHGALGVRWPADVWAQAAASKGGFVVVDASQLVSSPRAWNDWAADAFVLDGRAVGAPPGVACLLVRDEGVISARWGGGGQEYERRPGTQAVPLIAGLATAVERAQDVSARPWIPRLEAHDGIETWRPTDALRLGNTLLLRKPGMGAAGLLGELSEQGIVAQGIPRGGLDLLGKVGALSDLEGWVSVSSGPQGLPHEDVDRLLAALGG